VLQAWFLLTTSTSYILTLVETHVIRIVIWMIYSFILTWDEIVRTNNLQLFYGRLNFWTLPQMLVYRRRSHSSDCVRYPKFKRVVH